MRVLGTSYSYSYSYSYSPAPPLRLKKAEYPSGIGGYSAFHTALLPRGELRLGSAAHARTDRLISPGTDRVSDLELFLEHPNGND